MDSSGYGELTELKGAIGFFKNTTATVHITNPRSGVSRCPQRAPCRRAAPRRSLLGPRRLILRAENAVLAYDAKVNKHVLTIKNPDREWVLTAVNSAKVSLDLARVNVLCENVLRNSRSQMPRADLYWRCH